MDDPGIPAPRRLTYVRLCDVRPAEENPKRHDLPAIAASIAEHGFIAPIEVDERTSRLIGGHGRVEALVHMREHGDPTPEGILVDNDGEWLVPVIRGWASKDDLRARAAGLSLNRTTEAGGWHERELAEMLEGIHADNATLFDGLGWTADDLEDLFRHVDPDTTAASSASDTTAEGSGDDPAGDDDAAQLDVGDAEPAAGGGQLVACPECGHHFRAG